MKPKEKAGKTIKMQFTPVAEHKVIYKQKFLTLNECLEQIRMQKKSVKKLIAR